MTISNNVLFFSDQIVEPTPILHALVQHAKSSPALDQFFRESVNALRLEIYALPEDVKQSLPSLYSIHDLVESNGDVEDRVVLSTVRLCIAQLGDYIRRVEQDPSLLGGDCSTPSHKRRVVGFCSGLLSAAAVAIATNLSDLTSIACHTALVSLRVGLIVRDRSVLIEPASDSSWSVAISGTSPTDGRAAIDQFKKNKSYPAHKQIYVSSETSSNIVVSGPPSVLTEFVSSCSASGGLRCSRLPIFGAFHAKHLPSPKTESVIGSSDYHSLPIPPGTQVIDPSSGSQYQAATFKHLLKEVLDHIFQRQLYPSKAVEGALKDLSNSDGPLKLSIFGPTNAENFLRQSTKAVGFEQVHILTSEGTQVPIQDSSEAIAIVGMSGRFPGGETLQQFWDVLVQNKDLHKQVPLTRWNAELHVDPTGKKPNTSHSAFGCFLDRPGAFDGSVFNISPREAMQTDPVQRQLLMTTYEALEMAGYRYDTKSDRSRIGTFIGVATDDWREYNISQDIDLYFVTGGLRSFASGRLNYFFKFEGPSYVVDTACSSSGAAMELACASLLSGKCDMAVSGGGSIMTGPNLWAGLSRGGFVSPTGGCKTFDETADGYCRGEGVGIVVLKRLADAIAEGDQIQGVIRGIATNHSANAASITQPHSLTQISLYNEVLRAAGLRPNQVDYVEMHGTGTQAGDVTEMQSVVSTFGQNRPSDKPLYVGGVKANVGHGEGAAGVTGLIKSLMMFREKVIPPHAGIKTRINPKMPPLEELNIKIARRVEPFLSLTEPRRVLISSFGASGGNTCLIVEEPPKQTQSSANIRSHHVLAISAKGPISLRGNKQRLLEFLTAYPEIRLEDISYTLTARRSHHNLRSAYCVSNVKELRQTLSTELSSTYEEVTSSRGNSSQVPMVFVFPGQGFNFCGLAKVLFNTCSPFKECLILLDDMAKSMELPSFIHRLLDDTVADMSKLSPVQAHLAIVAIEIALARLLKSWGLVPSAVVGHSLGEYAALCIAGVLTVADTLLLVGKRAQLVEELCTNGTHGMLVIQASVERVKSLLKDTVTGTFEIACVNGPQTTVVNGRMKILESIQVALHETHRVRSSYVSVPYSFHSAQLDPILDEYRQVANSVTFFKPTIPVASTLLGKIVDSEGIFSASYMVDQTRKPVQFQAAIQAIQAAGLATPKTMFVETGPGAMCLSMTQASLGSSCKLLPCLKSADSNWKTLSKVVAEAYTGGIAINWSEYHKQPEANLTMVDLPSYHFNSKDYWIQYEGGIAALQEEVANLKAQLGERTSSVPNVQEHHEEQVVPPPINTCLHRVIAESISTQEATVEIITDIQEVSLRQLISGHKVIGIALAPSSLYKDMALGAAKYLYERMPHGKPVQAMDLHDMSITSPMFLHESIAPQLITIRATMKSGSTTAQIAISSEGKPHCRCTVDLSTADWTCDWSRRSYLIKDRVRTLMSPPPDKYVHHLLKDMVYKIFFPITEYSNEYRSISEIYIDHSFREAAVRLDLRETPEGSNFTFDPCWLDNIAQTAGFVLNSDVANPDEMICMSTGVDTMRLSKAFSGGKKYLCHVRAESTDELGNDLVCDVTVFDDEGVVALGEGLRFKRIKKTILQKMLGMSSIPKSTLERGRPSVTPSQPTKPVTTVAKLPSPTPNSQANVQTPVKYDKARLAAVQVTPVLPIPDSKGDNQIAQHLSTTGTFIPEHTFRAASKPSEGVPKSRNHVLDDETIQEKVSDNNDEYVLVEEIGYSSSTSNAAGSESSRPSERDNQDITSLESSDEHEPETSPGSGLIDAILDAIAKETGLERSDISEDTLFVDMGIDSLMSVAVLGVVKSATGEELPANLFTDCESMVEVRQMLLEEEKEVNEVVLDEKPPAPEPIQEPKIVVKPPMKMFNPDDYESKAVLVQGRPRPGGPILFLVTDGGGLAAVYVQLPPLAPGLAVYALDSPFMGGRESEYFAPGVNIEGIASIYARAVRKVQPHGPYMLGGYSIGGVYAYELTRYLINTGDRVHSFLCLDAACPRSLRGIIDVDVEVCQMMGMFDSISEEDQRKPLTAAQKIHVAGCVRTAGNFDPVPVKPEDRPEHIYCIWARTGFVDHLSDKIIEVGHAIAQREGIAQELNPEWLEWLGSEKVSFGPRGWERLLGDNIETFVIEGDHFSIMMRPRVKVEMGPLCQKLMKRILSTLDKTHTASSLVSQGVKSTVSGANSKIKEAYRAALALAPKYAEEAGCLDFLTRVYPGQKRLVLAYIVEAFAKLGCSLKDMPQGTALEPAGVLPKFGQLLDALREILEDGRLLEWRNGKRIRTYRPIEQTSSQTLYEALIKQNQPHAATHQLLHVTGSRLAECLTGAEDPMHIMFAQNRRLLQEFYTQAPMLVVASRLVTEVLRRVFTGSTEVIRILEVGAGLGGTTKYILDMLTEAGIPFKFTYTDVSPSLTGSAKQRYKHLPRGSIEYMTLDIEQPAPPELLGRFHAVISTNCIHATKSLTASCANARKMLRPGGFLAVVEVMPRLFWLDLVFGLLEGWWLFEDGRRHCLASESFWISSLEAAGYSNVVYAEEGDGYKPNPQVIVACTD